MLKVNNLILEFGEKRILNDLSFEVNKGEKLAILGPSGEGKSVLLKTILGLLKPTSGTVEIDSISMHKTSETILNKWRKKVGILFQGSALFDFMTVAENIAFPLLVHTEQNEEERLIRVNEALKMVGLEKTNDVMPDELSGGMQKRVALARAIVNKPEYMFYDEPTSGLDPVRARVINELIAKLGEQLNLTSIIITHDMVSLEKIADKILFLKNGKMVFFGSFKDSHNNSELNDFINGRGDDFI